MTDTKLPIEDPGKGMYIHQPMEGFSSGVKVMTVTDNGETRYFVAAEDFMAVQKERDDYRRSLALVNAWRVMPEWRRVRARLTLERIFEQAGMTKTEGLAVADLVCQVREGAL